MSLRRLENTPQRASITNKQQQLVVVVVVLFLVVVKRGRYAYWARKNLHRASLRELSRCRHAALDRILLIPTETYVGDPEQCSRVDDSPDDPGISNAWDSSDSRGASGGGPSRGA